MAICGGMIVATWFATPAISCDHWNISGQQEIDQANHIPVVAQINQNNVSTGVELDGTARYYSRDLGVVPGSLSGTLNGTHVSIKIDWSVKYPTGLVGVYEGDIDQNGRVTGTTWNEINPVSSKTGWHVDHIACADTSAKSSRYRYALPGRILSAPSPKPIIHLQHKMPPVTPGDDGTSSSAPDGDASAPSAPGGDATAPGVPGGGSPPPGVPTQSAEMQDVLSGQWQGKVIYDFQQTDSGFTWWSRDLQESATGTIDGDALSVSWTGPNGAGGMNGHIVERDAGGRATRIRWDNGQLWLRVN
jgi:hypothetical protein